MADQTVMGSARDTFIEALHSRRMLKPGEEWVIDANLARYTWALADKLRAQGHTEAASLISAEAVLLTNSLETGPVPADSGGQA
ncbi:hypothetical protein [Streptomyces sp. NPDC048516]|uniref:hypothetical protein n=1 Tax=Streptomyces sp. NPDC048516 TaxID=3365565 RepID=UPI003717FBB0